MTRAEQRQTQPRLRLLAQVAGIVAVLMVTAALLSACFASGRHHAAVAAAASPSPAAPKTRITTTPVSRPARHLVRNARPQRDWRPHTGPVPILVYHALGTPPASEPYPGLYVSRREFEAEMRWLARNGYQAVTLDEVMRAWFRGGTLPARPIVITFDNGYPAQVTFAPAVLSRYGWPGVLNEITAGHLDQAAPPADRHRLGGRLTLCEPSRSHTLGPAELRYQVVASRRYLRRTFHIPVNSFCYPSSKYDRAVIAAVRAAGYSNATTENAGYATRAHPFQLDRFEIEGGESVAGLAADLSGG